jgi:hypothetical protein
MPVPYFLLFLCFRKAIQEIFLELDETKVEVPIFPDTRWSPKQRRGRAKGQPTIGWHGLAPGCATRWWGHLAHLLTLPFRLYILLGEKTVRTDQFSRKHTASRRRCQCEIGRVQKLFPASCRREESPPEAFFITMPTSGVMCE